jgi:glyoxylase-like metal-dependent hydrolase (beta-lactamase superfamily II)
VRTLALTLLTMLPAQTAAPAFSIVEAAPGVFAAIADPSDARTTGNAGFVIGSDSVVVVDAFASEEGAERLLAEIRSRTKNPIRFLVLTHFHSDHAGGAAVFARAGATILAHENVRAWERREWQTDLDARAKERYAKLRLPDVTYRDKVTLWLGDRSVEVVHRPGHTGSDSLVAVPEARILFGGDLIQKRTIPGLRFANTADWMQTLDGLLKDDPDWTFVPGHGAVGHALDLRLFRDYLNSLRLAVSRGLAEGKTGPALRDAVKTQLESRYGSWAEFSQVDENIADVEAELTGRKVYPPAPPG